MATFTPPVATEVTPRFCPDSTPGQVALFKYMRPLDQGVNTYIWSDGTVTTDLSVPLSDGSNSSTTITLPQNPTAAASVGPPEGASGGPYGPPPPYATVTDATSGVVETTEYEIEPYLVYWLQGGTGPYCNISANLVSILTAAKFDNYISA